MEINNDLINRFIGTLFGQAVGDALGLGTEFMSKKEVAYYYPQGLNDYTQIIQDVHRSRWSVGNWTDDTDQMTMILDSLLEKKLVQISDIARRFWNWAFVAKGQGIGLTTVQVLTRRNFISHPHQSAQTVWEESNHQSAANGGVMRTSVVGLWDFYDSDKIRDNAEKICKITHADPRCIGSCVIVSLLVNELVKGRKPDKNLFDEIIVIANQYDERIKPFIEKALQADHIDRLELDDQSSMGYTLKTLSAGIWALSHAYSFEEGLTSVILQGGDADTNGAVAGSLLGARFGLSQIPEKWVSGLRHQSYLYRAGYELIDELTRSSEGIPHNDIVKRNMLLVLDDNNERINYFKQISLQLMENIQVMSWNDAPTMLKQIDDYFSQALLISLDHDLYNFSHTSGDPGCGRDVANHLADCSPVCPVVIHSSNVDAAWGMYNVLHFAGWSVVVVPHTGQVDWYTNDWLKIAKEMVAVSKMISKVVFLNQDQAEQQMPMERTAVISITDHEQSLANLHKDWHFILRLQFDDIDFPHLRSSAQKKLLALYEKQFSMSAEKLSFNTSHAQQIKSWLSQIENQVSTVIVHCKRGESRSAAIAKFICEKYGLSFDENYKKYNKWVYHLLTQKMITEGL